MIHRPRGKKFTPQIPRDELLARTSDALRDHGVDHHSQAVLMSAIGNEILSSDNPLFIPVYPHPKFRDTLAWKRSYAIVLKFLEENKMELTYDMIKNEYPEFSESLFGTTNFLKKLTLTQFLSERIKKSTNIGFNKRVTAFVQGKPLARPSYAQPPAVKPVIPKSSTKDTTTNSKKNVISSELKPFPKPQKTSPPSKQSSQTQAKTSPKPSTPTKSQKPPSGQSSPQSNQQKFKEQKNLAPLEVNQTFKKPSIRDLKNIPSPKTDFDPDGFNYTDSPKSEKNENSSIIADDFDGDFVGENSGTKSDKNNETDKGSTSEAKSESNVADDFIESENNDKFDESSSHSHSQSQSQAHQSETDDFIDVESKTQSSETKKESEFDNEDDFEEVESEASKSQSQSQTQQSETDDFIDVESKTQSSEAKKESEFDNEDDFEEVESEASKSQSQVQQSETDDFIDVESKTQSSAKNDDDDDDFIDVDEEASTKKESESSMIEVVNDEESNIQSNSNTTSAIDDSSIAIQSTIKSEISDYESVSQKDTESGIEIEFENDSKSDITVEEFDDD